MEPILLVLTVVGVVAVATAVLVPLLTPTDPAEEEDLLAEELAAIR